METKKEEEEEKKWRRRGTYAVAATTDCLGARTRNDISWVFAARVHDTAGRLGGSADQDCLTADRFDCFVLDSNQILGAYLIIRIRFRSIRRAGGNLPSPVALITRSTPLNASSKLLTSLLTNLTPRTWSSYMSQVKYAGALTLRVSKSTPCELLGQEVGGRIVYCHSSPCQ